MKIQNEKTVYLVLFLICLGFIFMFFNKIFIPIKADVEGIQQEYANKLDIHSRLSGNKDFVINLISVYKKESDVSKVDLALPSDARVYEIIVLLKTMAKESKVDVKNFAFNDYVSLGVGVVNVKFDVLGDYLNIKKLIDEIGVELRIMDVDLVKLEKEGSYVKGHILLNTYFKN
jgi:hypothetical protein